MKLVHALGLMSVVTAFAGAGLLAACSSDSGNGGTTPTDGGTDSATHPDTGTGNPDTGTGNPDSGNPDSATAAPSCAAYCTAIMANCTGANQQYLDNTTCLAMCAKLTVGAAGDTSGDTVGCRQYHAGAAAMNATLHCPHAGPTGASVCSDSVCSAFCELDVAQCSGAMAAYPDKATCMTDCMGYAKVDGGTEIGTTGGNTLDCRIYHLENAYKDPATHCPHTGPSVDAGPCH